MQRNRNCTYHGCIEQWSSVGPHICWCYCRNMLQRIGTSPWWWLRSCRFPWCSSRWCVTKRVIDIIHMRPHIQLIYALCSPFFELFVFALFTAQTIGMLVFVWNSFEWTELVHAMAVTFWIFFIVLMRTAPLPLSYHSTESFSTLNSVNHENLHN